MLPFSVVLHIYYSDYITSFSYNFEQL